jgi:hypothetical protein
LYFNNLGGVIAITIFTCCARHIQQKKIPQDNSTELTELPRQDIELQIRSEKQQKRGVDSNKYRSKKKQPVPKISDPIDDWKPAPLDDDSLTLWLEQTPHMSSRSPKINQELSEDEPQKWRRDRETPSKQSVTISKPLPLSSHSVSLFDDTELTD